MEKKNNKRKVMLIAAFAVAVIALAGVGYAATLNYKATTVNDDNDATSVYVLVTQDYYTSKFGGQVKFNTYTDTAATIYSLAEDDDVDGVKTGQQIGDGVNLTFTNDDANAKSYNIGIKTTAA